MSEEQSKPLTAFLAILPIGLLLMVDFFIESLQLAEKLIPHLAFGVLIAQLLCLVAFIKGEICPGQRGRLIKANACFALYWFVWLGMSLSSPHHYVMTDIVSLCGLSAVYAVWKQPKDDVARRGFLLMASLVSGFGVIAYLMIFFGNPTPNFMQYNPLAQALMGVLLANLCLSVSRNRLQGFIALLPLLMILLLALNALAVLIFIIYQGTSAVVFSNVFAYGIYFLLHLVIAGVLLLHSVKKWKLSYNSLLILFFMASSLPVWAMFI